MHASDRGKAGAVTFQPATIHRLSGMGLLVHVARPGSYSVRLSAHEGRSYAAGVLGKRADDLVASTAGEADGR